jgi:hypothetical protein
MIIKKPAKILLGVFFIAVLILIIISSNFNNSTKTLFLKNKGFKRNLLYPLTIELIEKINLNTDEYKILGYDENKIILFGQSNKTLLSISSDIPVNENKTITIDSIIKKKIEINNVTYDSISNEVIIFSSLEGKIYKYNIKNNKLTNSININMPFSKGLIIDSEKYILTQQYRKEIKFTFNGFTYDSMFKKLEKNGLESNLILNNMVDDGELLKNNDNFLFISYYKNSVYLISPSLKSLFKFNLIDTVNVGPLVSFSGTNGTGILKYTSPLRICNPHFCTYNLNLYVHSLVIADNDIDKEFKKNNIIDVYDLKNQGKYIGTYSLPKLDNKELKDFLIYGKKIFFVYENKLLIYEKNDIF